MERKTDEQSLAELTRDIQQLNAKLDKRQSQSESEPECAPVCALCGGGCLIFALGVSLLVWLVYSIIALTEISDTTVREDYCGSLLWRYLLIMCVILTLSHISASKNSSTSEESSSTVICSLICTCLLHLGLAIWGSYELWGRTCDKSLENLSIYTMSYIITVYQFVASGIVVLVMIGSCVYMTCIHATEPVKTNSLAYMPPDKNQGSENV